MLIDTISLELFSHTEHWKENGQLVLRDRFFMLRRFSFASKDFLRASQPYRLREGRVVVVRRGSADYTFNLVDHHFAAGDVVVFLTDTLIEKQGHSADFEVDAFSFDFGSPSLPRLRQDVIILKTDEAARAAIQQHISLLWDMSHEAEFPRENVRLLLSSLLLYISRRAEEQQHCAASPSDAQPKMLARGHHREEILRRFIALVSQHAARERNIPFYADRLCLAPHYLSTLIKQVSGHTVMQWINQTAIKEVKVWLAYSDETAAQIADSLNFPSLSSLIKFFKRETGMTPGQYRARRR